MWDRSIPSGYQNFPLLQQLQTWGTKKYIQFPRVLSEILCNQYTKSGKQFILNTGVCSCLRLHPIHLENSTSTGLLGKGEVSSLPTTASQRNQSARSPEIKTWLLLKAAHTPCPGAQSHQDSCSDHPCHAVSGSNGSQPTATGALWITMVTVALGEPVEPVTTKPTNPSPDCASAQDGSSSPKVGQNLQLHFTHTKIA